MERTWMPTVAGILDIVAGVSSLIGSFFIAFVAAVSGTGFSRCFDYSGPGTPFFISSVVLSMIAVLLFTLGAVAVIGGIQALRRASWTWSLIGGISAIFCFFPLGIAALIMTVMAEKEIGQSR